MNGSEIRAKLQMVGNRIIRLDIKNDFVCLNTEDDDIERGLDVSYELSDLFHFDDGALAGNVIMHIEANAESGNFAMRVQLDIEGCFAIDGDSSERELKDLLAVSGTAALYSIARGIISSVTSQACANGTLLLPMLNMFELRGRTKKNGGQN